MDPIAEQLKSLKGGKVLDIATGRGEFLQLLRENLGQCESLTGIDIKEFPEWKAERFSGVPIVDFKVMDAQSLQFEDDCFSLVSISNSLHHLPDPHKAVDEMVRVLMPGGCFLLHEMIADDEIDSPYGTHTLLHQWWGKIDSTRGIFHRPPYLHSELKQLVQHEKLKNWMWMEERDNESDPRDAQTMEELEKIIRDYQGRTTDAALIAEGEDLKERVKRIGFLPATALWGFGFK